jgi:membrane associated rhomboid family serine protease
MPRRPSRNGLVFVAAMAAVMWVVEVVDRLDGGRLDRYGIEPRDPDGLFGIVAAPFLHAGFGHLLANTVPFLLMGGAIALGGLARVVAVTAIVAFVSGLGTWLVGGGGTVHIGASGIVFGYAAYLLARGIFNRNLAHLGLGVLVAVVWGTALLGGLIPQAGISWQAHLFGALGGVLAARALRARRARPPAAPTAPATRAPARFRA